MEFYPYFNTFHFVGIVAWFGGLFDLVRMFVYHEEAFDKSQPERDILTVQFELMENRVYKIICNPAMVITWICGVAMIVLNGREWFQVNLWMHFKLTLLLLLSGYQHYCKSIIKKLAKGKRPHSSFQFRLLNELPTLFLLAIVMIAVFRNTLNGFLAFLGILAFGLILFLGVKFYKKIREKEE